MIELYSLMWVIATFTAVIGFLRGWNREIIVTAGAILAMFLLFQFDSIIRGVLLLNFPRDQVFFIQAGVFLLVVYAAYQAPVEAEDRRGRDGGNLQTGILGGLVGFLNGYLIMGTLWYFLDINEYPLDSLISAPSLASPSAQNISTIPLVILSGGLGGTGDFLAVIVIALFLLVIVSR